MRAFVLALCAALASSPAVSQTSPASSSQDFHFSVSSAQAWTDTGLDLHPGDALAIKSTPATSQANACRPKGSGSIKSDKSLPVTDAPVGSLIGKLQKIGDPFLIGDSKTVNSMQAGHLFLGVNGQPACTGDLSVSVTVTRGREEAEHPAQATPVAPGPASGDAAGAAVANSQSPRSVKDKLSTAAQTWLSGQLGNGNASGPQQSAAASPGIANNIPAATAAIPSVPAIATSMEPIDSSLAKDISSLPRRVNDEFKNLGDMVNFVIVGSKEQVQDALTAANWHLADVKNDAAVTNAVLETINKRDYLAMPMSQLMLFGRFQDFGYEQAEPYSVVASRHHFRLWKAPFTFKGRDVWVGAGTHDIGFEKDQRNGKVTHKIDPAVDGERDTIARSLQQAGKVASIAYYLPPDPVQEARNATGGSYHSDGRLAVITLK